MKIAYICSDVEIPVFGHEGCSIHIREFTSALAELGHEVFILASWLGGAPPPDLRARVYPIEPAGLDAAAWAALEQEPVVAEHCLGRDLKSLFGNGWLPKLAVPLFEREKPDFIYERYALFGWSGAELAARFRLPFILEVNAPIAQEQDGYEQFTLVRTADRVEQEVFRRADAIVAVSAVVADWLKTRGVPAERILVAPNAVSPTRFKRAADAAGVRARLGLGDRRVIGFVGSFQPWHDVAGLIRAFACVRRAHADLRLLLIGCGPQRDELAASVETLGLAETVAFVDAVSHAEIPDCLAAMDVAVAPYACWGQPFYGSPMKVFEYMMAGRPIVAAALGQIADVIEPERTGLLYAPGDHDGLVAALERMLADPAAAAAMGAAARAQALREHTWQAVAGGIINRASELIRSGNG